MISDIYYNQAQLQQAIKSIYKACPNPQPYRAHGSWLLAFRLWLTECLSENDIIHIELYYLPGHSI